MAAQSVAMMTVEIVLTRIFSVILGYHFAFFSISVALFGVGAGAVLVHLRKRSFLAEHGGGRLSTLAAFFSVAIVAVDFLMLELGARWSRSPPSTVAGALFGVVVFFTLAAAPFFVGGVTVCAAISKNASEAPRLYAADLAGAALGCLLVVPLLGALGGPGAMLGAAAFAGAASVLFAKDEADRGGVHARAGHVVSGVAVLFGAVLFVSGFFEVRAAKGLDLERTRPEWSRWNSFSMVSVLPVGGFRGWGVSPRYSGPVPEQKALLIDLGALTMLNRFDGSPGSARYALFDLSAMVYRLRPAPAEVCIVGAGGGKDVLAAIEAGAGHVTGVEINPLVVDGVLRGAYRDYTGNLYGRPGTDVFVEDGRTFVRRTRNKYDVLLLSMVDTSAATGAGAYSLTENSLYTTDAFGDFFDRLAENGIFSVSSVTLEGLAVGARLVSVARAALERRGRDPSRSIALLQTNWIGTPATLHDVLVKPTGFTDEELFTLKNAARELSFSIGYVPGDPPGPGPENSAVHLIATGSTAAVHQAMESWPLDVSPVDDSRPFFFYQNRLRDFSAALKNPAIHIGGLSMLAKVLVVASFMVLLFLGIPIAFAREELRGGRGPSAIELSYVACLGAGFMCVEIGVLQRFSIYLGQPTYSLVVVLFLLLLFGALGSRCSPGLDLVGRPARTFGFFLGISSFVGLATALLPALLRATAPWPLPARIAACAIAVAPLGFALGIPLPVGIRCIAARSVSRVPWIWAVNSAMSVLGSVLATFAAIHAGIGAAMGSGVVCYVVAGLLGTKVLR